MKKSFLLYCDTFEVIKRLSNEQKGMLLERIYKYNLGNDIETEVALPCADGPEVHGPDRAFLNGDLINDAGPIVSDGQTIVAHCMVPFLSHIRDARNSFPVH